MHWCFLLKVNFEKNNYFFFELTEHSKHSMYIACHLDIAYVRHAMFAMSTCYVDMLCMLCFELSHMLCLLCLLSDMLCLRPADMLMLSMTYVND